MKRSQIKIESILMKTLDMIETYSPRWKADVARYRAAIAAVKLERSIRG